MKRKGITPIEILIVIFVITFLVVLIAPRWTGASREARLKVHLQEIRKAIRLFHTECGDFPAKLEDIVTTQPPEAGGNDEEIDPKKFKGPYLITPDGKLPANPINNSNAVKIKAGSVEPVGWVYDPKTGEVYSIAWTTKDGSDYSRW